MVRAGTGRRGKEGRASEVDVRSTLPAEVGRRQLAIVQGKNEDLEIV